MVEPDLTDVVIDVLDYARSGPPVDDLLAFFTTRALTLVDSDSVVVRPRRHAGSPASAADPGPARDAAAAFPVTCGSVAWGELLLAHEGGPVAAGEARRGELLAGVLSAALAEDALAGSPGALCPDTTASTVGGGAARGPDEMVELVLGCVDDLDRMPEASTRSRLALVVERLAEVVGAAEWSVGVVHHGWLHDVTGAPRSDGTAHGEPGSGRGPVPVARFPARRRASAGSAFYADRRSGDEAERRALAATGHFAVTCAGGYDLDGRAWVAQVWADEGSHLGRVTAVLAALVMAALGSPREASVPRPEEHWVKAVLQLPAASGEPGEQQGFDATA